ncbi:uncharacterized protein LOC120291779 [Eucalyptus grandis]|uniref:uncharacterized protein LOC120291779 n=1 Tax=Eucalyptus grandis TaxID=71139 RepID=UPI00192EB021|nr:uncharacterized protein LOC120291779 [Eucalyptus grandis]
MQNPNDSEIQNPDQPRNTSKESFDQSAPTPVTGQLPTPTSWPYAPWVPVQGPWATGPSSGDRPEFNPGGSGMNPYPNFPPGFAPLVLPPFAGRPEPGDALYTSSPDGPAATHHPSTHRTGSLLNMGEGFSAGSGYQGQGWIP